MIRRRLIGFGVALVVFSVIGFLAVLAIWLLASFVIWSGLPGDWIAVALLSAFVLAIAFAVSDEAGR